jgi:glyoxylase-like metal-dependent hydrolase (beta-lactamase superfamily II)
MNITRLVTGPLSVNTWFIPVGGQSLVVVDPGGDAELIIAHLSRLEFSPALFFLTHGHFDHLTGLPALAAAFPDVPVAIHSADASFLGEGALERHYRFFTALGAGSVVTRYKEELPPPDILLAEGTPVFLADGKVLAGWDVLHTPGHSPGSVCLYNRAENILVSGDTLFRSGVGRTDAPGGSSTALDASLERLFSLPAETLVLCGHGEQTTIGREKG